MITPFFKLEQTEEHVVVTIKAPNANIRDAEIDFCEKTFIFSAAPYFLRLYLPGFVGIPENSSSDYEADSGTFVIKVPKQNKGEEFKDLEMLSELLKPQRPSGQSNVEELEEEIEGVLADQKLQKEEESPNLEEIKKFGYGFGWYKMGIMKKFGEELEDLFAIRNPDEVEITKRYDIMVKNDEKSFDSEHYLADLFDVPDELTQIIKSSLPSNIFTFNDDDRLILKDLKVIKLKRFTAEENKQIMYSLLDILFSYLLDLRINDWEPNVQSDVMVAKISPSISNFVRFSTLKDSITSAIRRTLCYCLYRNFDLCKKELEDLDVILEKGRSCLLHCLLALRKRFYNSSHDFIYLFNQLFIDDYCIWIQIVDEKVLEQVREELKEIRKSLQKSDISELDLDYIETEAKMIMMKVENGEYDSDDN
ncbi:unnamed protein product [Bursaphelenchus xylophilus]|uniref:Protein SHQ1 homolog n=1 Tax=Bursaphelenchus xylophilus TaxID=6326 RepID=A0A1I7RI51_BURXY|nr:unnamed protein product [Bursaphelenchus xylophilus]CAG9115153.1 unnamed protein product [Bursaphelenchus xylophilus]